MSKQTFVVFSCGCRHVVSDADAYNANGGEVSFFDNGQRIAYFSGVSAVLVQTAQSESALPLPPESLPVAGSVAALEVRPTIEIGALNITCTADPAEFAGQIIKALQSIRVTPGGV